MKVMGNQIRMCKFHPKTLSSDKPLASLARDADWANVVDLPAF